jgi:alpha-1,3-mannosyltransferase
MRQVSLFIKGERDYVNLTGPTGPLVSVFLLQIEVHAADSTSSYPAGHVYIHKELYDITMEGRNIPLAQQLYGALYIVSLALTCGVYHQSGSIPNWVLLLLPLSKRLHSLYALRLFNDCWAAVLSQAAVFTLQRRSDLLGTALLRYVIFESIVSSLIAHPAWPSRLKCRSYFSSQGF